MKQLGEKILAGAVFSALCVAAIVFFLWLAFMFFGMMFICSLPIYAYTYVLAYILTQSAEISSQVAFWFGFASFFVFSYFFLKMIIKGEKYSGRGERTGGHYELLDDRHHSVAYGCEEWVWVED
ncbi:MAG: hypothetical protein ACXADB_06050 [Candidatus Hermodarchaeia archaeon]|jgi:hypothetical protein